MQTSGGATALMYACQQCKEVEVLEILRKQPFAVKDRDRTLKSPLHYCAENPNTSCAEAVLKACPQLVNAQDENGYSTLHLAVIAGNKTLVKLLIMKGVDVNVHDNEGHSAVHWSIVSSEKEALEMIIRAGANPSTPDVHGGYPLHYAVQMCGSRCDYPRNFEDTVRVVETLLNFGVDVNVKDKDGRQPILWAASAGSADAVIHLVSGGACVEAADKDGLTALHCAASRGHTSTLETLVSLCGANVDLIDANGCSALFYSVTLGHADATELLLRLGAEPNRQDRKGRTPAHCGAAKGQLETLRILQKHGGNLWMRNVKGDIPLHEAVASGRKDLVLWLISQNSEAINIANNDGRCPLHIASMYNNTEMVKVLLDSKSLVNPVMRTSKGVLMTPLNVALCKGHRSCGKYLQLHGGVPFSKVSKVEPTSAVRVSPSDDLIILTGKVTKEIATSSQNKNSKSRSSTDVKENQEINKTETSDKKKVYRRRKKKKTSSHLSTQDTDTDDDSPDLKTPDGRKNIRSSKENIDEDGSKLIQTQVENKTQATDEVVMKTAKTNSLVKTKSFNETKNVSDLSPVDFPPLMQTINQLDTVIMEPDANVSKCEDERKRQAVVIDLSSESGIPEITQKEETIEKLHTEVRSIPMVTEETFKKDDVRKEETSSQTPAVGEEAKQNTVKADANVKTSGSKSSADESFTQKSVKSPKNKENDGGLEEKNSKGSDVREKQKKTVKDQKVEEVPSAEVVEVEVGAENKMVPEEVSETKEESTSEEKLQVTSPKNETFPELSVEITVSEVQKEKTSRDSVAKEAAIPEFYAAENTSNSEHQTSENALASREKEEENKNFDEAKDTKATETLEVLNDKQERKVTEEEKDVRKNETDMEAPGETESSENVDKPSSEMLVPGEAQTAPENSDIPVYAKTISLSRNEDSNAEVLSRAIQKRSAVKEKPEKELEESILPRVYTREEDEKKESSSVLREYDEEKRREGEGERTVDGAGSLKGDDFHPRRSQGKIPKVSRLCRRHKEFKEEADQVSVTQLVQNTIRKYHMERGIFYQLLELKRYQIRSGKANEQVLVKRLADEYERSRIFLGMKPFSGLYKFREFEKFLYDQLKALNARRSFLIPEVKSYDDIDVLSGFLKKSRYKIIGEIPQPEMVCTCITQRCHHSACAYTSVPCSAYITDLRRHRHHKQRRECFFPRIAQPPSLKSESRKLSERDATLELIQGNEKHVISLPRNSPTKGKRYYVTFTIKGAPDFTDDGNDLKDLLKHRHAKSV